jgi:hypothetical protein
MASSKGLAILFFKLFHEEVNVWFRNNSLVRRNRRLDQGLIHNKRYPQDLEGCAGFRLKGRRGRKACV